MKNVKTILIFIVISSFMFASAQRVGALGGNVGYWADDDYSYSAFPHTINNSNLAQVAGLGGDNHEAIVRWGDGTKWGFSWDQSAANDLMNIQWGNGTYGVTFGLAMAAADDGSTPSTATSSMGFSGSFGMQQDFGDIGVGFSNSSSDDGTTETNQAGSMGFWANLRRAQSVWLFDNMLAGFSYSSESALGSADAETRMGLNASLYTHIDVASNTTALVALGFGYSSRANRGNVKDATSTTITLPSWTFAVESAMTDWATIRVGYWTGYALSNSSNSGATGAKDQTSRGGLGNDFSVGIGFNYGNFNLDMSVSEDLFTNPVAHMTGFKDLNPESATATLTYVW